MRVVVQLPAPVGSARAVRMLDRLLLRAVTRAVQDRLDDLLDRSRAAEITRSSLQFWRSLD